MATNSLVCVNDYEEQALSLLDKRVRDYYSCGADDGQTLSDNVADFRRLRLRPRMMVDVSNINMKTTLLGQEVAFPVCVAPTGIQKLAHPDGELATARASASLGTCMCLSTGSTVSLGELAENLPELLLWFQLYVCKDRDLTRQLVKQAERAGCKALVVTVDRPEQGTRRTSITNKFSLPLHLSFKNLDSLKSPLQSSQNNKYAVLHTMFDNTLTWEDIQWLTTITNLPVIAKGVLTGVDAVKALESGCKAIYVSNHGGRQLDGVCSTISVLSEVVKAVNGRAEVYLDGGVRTGTDVLKALALGARAVFVGRPPLYGLAVAGEEGARNVLTILRNELKLAMQLSGVTDVQSVSRDLVTYRASL
ncbi:HAO1 [Bugula neritina]|uniref:(S)-2-hydroxy-acid oxidase n=1 Tax=Bugula neritina TaxID=10212 RepID=A0A7J7KKZ9_BUGNE|nr:HAO1 [Bugula neritina]